MTLDDAPERLLELKAHGEMLGAYGIVLATTAPTFWDKVIAQAGSAALFGGSWPRLTVIEGLK